MKINIPKKLTVIAQQRYGRTIHRMFLDCDEFPYGTKPGSLKVEKVLTDDGHETGCAWATVTFLIDDNVTIPESYYTN